MPHDVLTLAEALLYLRRFTTCAVDDDVCASFDRLVTHGLAEMTGEGCASAAAPGIRRYRITASGDGIGKAVLRHVQACEGTLDRARPDGCFERLHCPRCGEDIEIRCSAGSLEP